MTNFQFNKIQDSIIDHCIDVLKLKNDEYASDTDRLHNFKKSGERLGAHPAIVARGFLEKHLCSVDDMILDIGRGNRDYSDDYIYEKIGDVINYHILLAAIILEACHPILYADQPNNS